MRKLVALYECTKLPMPVMLGRFNSMAKFRSDPMQVCDRYCKERELQKLLAKIDPNETRFGQIERTIVLFSELKFFDDLVRIFAGKVEFVRRQRHCADDWVAASAVAFADSRDVMRARTR